MALKTAVETQGRRGIPRLVVYHSLLSLFRLMCGRQETVNPPTPSTPAKWEPGWEPDRVRSQRNLNGTGIAHNTGRNTGAA